MKEGERQSEGGIELMWALTFWLGSSSAGLRHLRAHLTSGSPFLGL